MAILRQDIESIERLAQQVKHERDVTVNDLLSKLRGINAELDAAWDGPSQQAFYATYGDWIQQLEKFSNTLNSVHEYLVSVATNFRELDEAARQAAAGAAVAQ
ncbi:MAG TPA: WXG100 family type VII secretion target [Anaerolineales bacterium]|jgi:WXG100 family type VII secretion target|nr:WXG100 family type VII secretion target [Anaerolineales bacterium]